MSNPLYIRGTVSYQTVEKMTILGERTFDCEAVWHSIECCIESVRFKDHLVPTKNMLVAVEMAQRQTFGGMSNTWRSEAWGLGDDVAESFQASGQLQCRLQPFFSAYVPYMPKSHSSRQEESIVVGVGKTDPVRLLA